MGELGRSWSLQPDFRPSRPPINLKLGMHILASKSFKTHQRSSKSPNAFKSYPRNKTDPYLVTPLHPVRNLQPPQLSSFQLPLSLQPSPIYSPHLYIIFSQITHLPPTYLPPKSIFCPLSQLSLFDISLPPAPIDTKFCTYTLYHILNTKLYMVCDIGDPLPQLSPTTPLTH